jgi:Ser/Thr protein kinase RdoA (MazF antagonist)
VSLGQHVDVTTLADVVSEWLATPVTLVSQIHNGDEAEVWSASYDGTRVVVHISPSWRHPEDLRWCHDVALEAGKAVPEAVAPIRVHGRSSTVWNDRVVAVFPFVEGDVLDRRDAAQVAAAARVLARIHTSLLASPLCSTPPRTSPVDASDLLRDSELDEQWSAVVGGLRVGVCHGDFYRRNILVAAGRIRGVIDWHDAYVGPLIGEVAFAAWEFGHDDRLNLNATMFELFVETYMSSSNHLPSSEYEVLLLATRVRLRENILGAVARGASIEDAYQEMQVRAFWQLRSLIH